MKEIPPIVFGRTMMNFRNRVNINLVNNKNTLKKITAKPSFERFQIFCEDLTGVENKMTSLFMNQPIYVGIFQVLITIKIICVLCIHHDHHHVQIIHPNQPVRIDPTPPRPIATPQIVFLS
ncbi:hypothetical protein KUTeg_011257 [Tegillarca granosa]|uniref:Uncharacterized protein n=1 Tax=Tegillarca granosa TaxID=220873 RepID=A0ABQ9F1C8_TEGGR|nr:hypothetical protein KUTeg_011257 [Tegillarca granosa]